MSDESHELATLALRIAYLKNAVETALSLCAQSEALSESLGGGEDADNSGGPATQSWWQRSWSAAAASASSALSYATAAFASAAPPPDLQSALSNALNNIHASLRVIDLHQPAVVAAAKRSDFDVGCQANGYRSLVFVLRRALDNIQIWVEAYTADPNNFSRAQQCLQHLQALGLNIMRSLMRVYAHAAQLAELTDSSTDLFFSLSQDSQLYQDILKALQSTSRECFYGQHLGFYHAPGVRNFLQLIGLAMVTYSDVYEQDSLASTWWTLVKSSPYYYFKPDAKAERFITMTQAADVSFTKSFWNLLDTTMARHWGKLSAPALAVNLLLKIPVRDEELEVGIRSSQGGFSLVQLENLEADPLPEIKPEPPLAAGQQPNELISSTAMELVLREETAHDPDPWLLVDLRPVVAPPMELSLRVAASGEDDEGEGAAPAVAVNAFGQRPAANPFNVITACKPLDEWLLQTMTSDDMMAPTVTARLLCAHGVRHQVINLQSRSFRSTGTARSRSIIIHCHGGGFVAQSSQSHEPYLRRWAKALNCPILSIDYSLAPEAPYPQALQECFYVYRWALANPAKLGTTAQRVILAGDSAGGNLVTALALRCALENVRMPNAVFAFYPALQVQFAVSASRLLSVMDPLLPEGVLRNCLEAYTGQKMETFSTSDPLLSPMAAPDALLHKLPPMYLFAAGLDPLLDDSIQFARRLRNLGKAVRLEIFKELPHGFLSFPNHDPVMRSANERCLAQLQVAVGGFVAVTPYAEAPDSKVDREALHSALTEDLAASVAPKAAAGGSGGTLAAAAPESGAPELERSYTLESTPAGAVALGFSRESSIMAEVDGDPGGGAEEAEESTALRAAAARQVDGGDSAAAAETEEGPARPHSVAVSDQSRKSTEVVATTTEEAAISAVAEESQQSTEAMVAPAVNENEAEGVEDVAADVPVTADLDAMAESLTALSVGAEVEAVESMQNAEEEGAAAVEVAEEGFSLQKIDEGAGVALEAAVVGAEEGFSRQSGEQKATAAVEAASSVTEDS